MTNFGIRSYGLIALDKIEYNGKHYRKGQFIPKSYAERRKPAAQKRVREKEQLPEPEQKEERGRERVTTEKQKDSFRERMDVVFDDWTDKDWKQVKSIYQMQTVLTTHRAVSNTRRDEYGNAITTSEGRETVTNKATLNQSRLAWELMKGRTYAKTRTGYTYSIKSYGLVALSPIVFRNKHYRKGQFLPKKYVSDK